MPEKPKNIFIFKLYDKERHLLYITKNPNFQKLAAKEWWQFVHHIITLHYDSLDAQADAMFTMKFNEEPMFNRPIEV